LHMPWVDEPEERTPHVMTQRRFVQMLLGDREHLALFVVFVTLLVVAHYGQGDLVTDLHRLVRRDKEPHARSVEGIWLNDQSLRLDGLHDGQTFVLPT